MSQERKPFEAMIMFSDPDSVPNATQALAAHGFHFVVDPTMVDQYSAAVFGTLTGVTEFDEDKLGTRLWDILGPLGVELLEWGYAESVS